ncbi:hypothetical protein QNI19_26075 [Cytophagaceae bacterium DM2B3-1]|uniref:Uncharacterized protein n=2 Tax=Xanthocytophaga TaxID=3078918 RepID=A0AAE3QJ64_9BACT|nr:MULTISPECIES: hypothetical protein [Xanthocytophaga]MDJ1468653.1 hypothetical protein [Xanthocytophaga flavus]MDJ1480307.1 hypothetical protein [Xanthocytophaga flavus]MDJ1496432.1 hypothetical protein [Xanthocytophaga flavus]MDJ1504187.1 hypothetical protein [Xanthocytophaga agilis]
MRDLKVFVGVLVFLFMAFRATQCGSLYNTIQQKDPNAESDYVYGTIDGPAKQLSNKYEADPEQDKKATQIREKFFGGAAQAEAGN